MESKATASAVHKLYQSLYTQTFNKVICIGRNYAEHAKEMKSDIPTKPMIFDKPLSSIIKSGSTFHLRRPAEIHHEVELCVLIGDTAKDVQSKDWERYVAGYFVGIDFTDRDVQSQAKKDGSPWAFAKGADEFMAVSEFVSKDQVKDPHNLDLLLTINDKPIQSENTKMLIFQIPTLIEYITKYMTLNKGDMIMTGTPSGVGPVKGGDVVKAFLKQDG